MAKKSIARNYIYNLIYQILAIIIPIITTPYLSRVLGAENIGIYSYTLSITTYFILFGSLGVATYGKREIAYVQEKKYERSKIFFEIIIMRFLTLSISLLAFYLCFCQKGEYSVYYQILLLEILASCIDISWFFHGLEEFKKTVTRNIIIKLMSVICIFLFVKTSNDLLIYFCIYTLSNFIGNISLWFYLPKYIEKIEINKLNILKHIKPVFILFIPQIATQIYTVLDKTMIGTIILDKSEVGFYEQAQKIVKILLAIATSLGTVMMPRISLAFAKHENDKIKKYMNKSFAFISMLAFPIMFGIISVSDSFVPLFFGNGYSKVAILIRVISPIVILIGISNVIGTQYLLPTKQQAKYTFSVITGAIVNFILNFILIKKYWSIGASIATVIAELSVTVVQLILVRQDIRIWDIIKTTHKYIISSIIMFLISMLIAYVLPVGAVTMIIQIVVSVIVYFMILVLMKDDLIFEGLYKIKKFLVI